MTAYTVDPEGMMFILFAIMFFAMCILYAAHHHSESWTKERAEKEADKFASVLSAQKRAEGINASEPLVVPKR